MISFSAGFVGAGYVALKIYGLGAQGLVLANAVNMSMRIVWSWMFVGRYIREKGVEWRIRDVIPKRGTIIISASVAWYMREVSKGFKGGFEDLLKAGAIGVGYGMVL